VNINIIEIALIAVALGCDAFAVGLGVGCRFCAPRQIFRLSFHFGLFQFMMPLAGWLAGRHILVWTQTWGPWIAFGLLMSIGGRMVIEGLQPPEEETECADPTRGFSLVMLSVATSIDALGVGFSLGVLNQNLFAVAVYIGITAAAMTWLAMKIGNRLPQRFAKRMEIIGGFILVAIAFKLLLG
jgi:manganese efflux pump family protein